MQRFAHIHAGDDHIQKPVVLEVIHNNAPGCSKGIQARSGRTIHKAPDVLL